MAVAKAQYAISEICSLLRAKGINVRVSGLSHVCNAFHKIMTPGSLRSIQWQGACRDSVMCYSLRLPCHMTVRYFTLKSVKRRRIDGRVSRA